MFLWPCNVTAGVEAGRAVGSTQGAPVGSVNLRNIVAKWLRPLIAPARVASKRNWFFCTYINSHGSSTPLHPSLAFELAVTRPCQRSTSPQGGVFSPLTVLRQTAHICLVSLGLPRLFSPWSPSCNGKAWLLAVRGGKPAYHTPRVSCAVPNNLLTFGLTAYDLAYAEKAEQESSNEAKVFNCLQRET